MLKRHLLKDVAASCDELERIYPELSLSLKDAAELTADGTFLTEDQTDHLLNMLRECHGYYSSILQGLRNLGISEIPARISDTHSIRDQYEKSNSVQLAREEALSFFSGLSADAKDVSESIAEMKQKLLGINPEQGVTEEEQSILDQAEAIRKAYLEPDAEKRFRLIYETKGMEKLAFAVIMGHIRHEEKEAEEYTDGTGDKDKAASDESETVQIQESPAQPMEESLTVSREEEAAEEEQTPTAEGEEEIGDAPEKEEPIPEEETPGQSDEEDEEDDEDDEDDTDEVPDDEEDLPAIPTVSYDADAVTADEGKSAKFSANRFKHEITQLGRDGFDAAIILIEAAQHDFNETTLTLRHSISPEITSRLVSKLYRAGYLKRFVVFRRYRFYGPTTLLKKVFQSKEARSYFSKNHLPGYLIDQKTMNIRSAVNDLVPSVVARALILNAMLHLEEIGPEVDFSRVAPLTHDALGILTTPITLEGDKKLLYLVLAADDTQGDYAELADYMKRLKTGYQLICYYCGTEHARKVAEWIADLRHSAEDVWYYDNDTNTVRTTYENKEVDVSTMIAEYCRKRDEGYEEEEEAEAGEDDPILSDNEENEEPQSGTYSERDIATVQEEDVKPASEEKSDNQDNRESDVSDDAGSESRMDGSEKKEEPVTAAAAKGTDSRERANGSASSETSAPDDVNEPEDPLTAHYEEEGIDPDRTIQEMLVDGKFYAACVYARALSGYETDLEPARKQLAYALNAPMEYCDYHANVVSGIFLGGNGPISAGLMLSAALRSCFYDVAQHDHGLPHLCDFLKGNPLFESISTLSSLTYTLQQYKQDTGRGVDYCAEYRRKDLAERTDRLGALRQEARDLYDHYTHNRKSEKINHKRAIETKHILIGPNSPLGVYLDCMAKDDRGWLGEIESHLAENYMKDGESVRPENIDSAKVEAAMDRAWVEAGHNIRLEKKSSTLMSSLRTNIYKKIEKYISLLSEYVYILECVIPDEQDPVMQNYLRIKGQLEEDIAVSIEAINAKLPASARKDEETGKTGSNEDLTELAGLSVLKYTLSELKERLDGSYSDAHQKYFYASFLKTGDVLLDEEYRPVMDEVYGLPEFSLCRRVRRHAQAASGKLSDRLYAAASGRDDDFNSLSLILDYYEKTGRPVLNGEELKESYRQSIPFARREAGSAKERFGGELELAQSFGQIDSTRENLKESIIHEAERWYEYACENDCYSYYRSILSAFLTMIHKDDQTRAEAIERNLNAYLDENPTWSSDPVQERAVFMVRERIGRKNYSSAEDMLNRILRNDLDTGEPSILEEKDFLAEFLDNYDSNYTLTAKVNVPVHKLLELPHQTNRTTKGAEYLVRYWPQGRGTEEQSIRQLLSAFGFRVNEVNKESANQDRAFDSFTVRLVRPENGRKIHYTHPIPAFGSEAETKPFRVVCLYGRFGAEDLIKVAKDLGKAKHTLVILNYAMSIAERKTLARKCKTELYDSGIFAVIDRVVLAYIVKNYSEATVSRMLMSVIMPFAYYQPYLSKSSNVMPQEIFFGRKMELDKIESAGGVNLVYGGRQLGKTALLRMAKKEIDQNENGDRAVLVDINGRNYLEAARMVSEALVDEKILTKDSVTDDWDVLARSLRSRLRENGRKIPYLLLMLDEADAFIDSCKAVDFKPIQALKSVQTFEENRFKFVIAGLRDIIKFDRALALGDNSVLAHIDSLTVKPFLAAEARELLETPLSYLGFRFPKDSETDILVSTILSATNYFPGLIQMYCTKMIEALTRDYGTYTEAVAPPYIVREDLIRRVLGESALLNEIRNKFEITLRIDTDYLYYIIALLVAHYYHNNPGMAGCSAEDILSLSEDYGIKKLSALGEEKIRALMSELCDLNILQTTSAGRYRFSRHSFFQMMGDEKKIDDQLEQYMEV